MSVTGRDFIEMEKPDRLTQVETVLEVLNEGVVIATPAGRPDRSVYRRDYGSFQFHRRNARHRRRPGNRTPNVVPSRSRNETRDSRSRGYLACWSANR